MAEFLFKDMVKKLGREKEFEISSRAVSDEEIWNGVGNLVYPPAKAELLKHGISCEGKRARLLTARDGEYYDLLLCMDESNLRRAKRIVGAKNEVKCRKLLVGRDVADPWYTRDFSATYRDIMQGLHDLIIELS